ncbi:PREDICTED: E3 ubiquitin-protein ligase TRIM71-like [Amphimedon queenslandica]|nr:PREDICTED: E3 ubiquitin-protein ligase TRIM71-like [Amphimedon queenslandica]|eukprot:XP_019855697.1 PREDICTED: E3 ubiquitin-protein ligase TRIM71-like [Amphimedon queenslandica]
MDGKLLKEIGCKGYGKEQFNNPFGITIDENTGKVYVADLKNHRIQVLNRDYSFSHSFGKKGKELKQFMQPNGTALDSQGNVFVTDTFNHRIQKFSQSGQYISYFGSEGPGPGQLKLPEKIVINNDYIYVTEHLNARVSVFTTEGKFVQCFGKQSSEGGLVWPRGLTFDKDGSLYVCDFRSHCIFKY